jgi:transcription initiation factor TFIID subunit 2
MAKLCGYEKNICIQVMDKISRNHISSMFSRPVDPEKEGLPTYSQIVQHPMDLGTVRSNLENDEYTTVEQWRNHVDLVWENTYKFNGRQSLIASLAKQLQTQFHDETSLLTGNPVTDWVIKFDNLRLEVERIAKTGPKPAVPSVPANKKMATRQQIEPLPTRPTREASGPPPPLPPARSPPAPKTLTEDEIVRLTEEVNRIENPDLIQKIVALIKRHEPQLATSGEELEIEVSKLRPSTLVALRNLVNRFA